MANATVAVPELPLPRTHAKRVAISTLGCKVNAFESELIGQSLRGAHWQQVDPRAVADLYVINTCTVTQEADRQARQSVRRAVRNNPDALVVVTGCYAQMDPEACAAIPGVDLVLGNDRKLDLHQLLPALEGGELPPVMVGDLDAQVSLPSELLAGYETHHRAFVQIQQGCDQGCTFCIIHRARGPSRSLAPTLIKRQVQRLVLNGYREIVLCGVDLGSYGQDLSTANRPYLLLDLLRELLSQTEGEFRMRLSSLDPAHLGPDLMELLATQDRLCPHLHLSLQSGNSLILKRMKRRYSAEQALERVQALRAHLPGLVLSADIMTGFPTETEAMFADTLSVVREMEIAYPHVFAYSPRSGTPAARIPRQVPVARRRQRAAAVRALGAQILAGVLQDRVGRSSRVLVESGGSPPPGHRRARAADYLSVWVPEPAAVAGQWLDAVYTGVVADGLIARATD